MSTDCLTISVDEFARLLGVGRSTIYQCLADGRLNGVRIGRRVLILRSEADQFLKASSLRGASR
jgi:excisionase family DNA binding protein